MLLAIYDPKFCISARVCCLHSKGGVTHQLTATVFSSQKRQRALTWVFFTFLCKQQLLLFSFVKSFELKCLMAQMTIHVLRTVHTDQSTATNHTHLR